MRIGVDFDNTIACYDGVFHAAALERSLIPPDLGQGKNAVRDYLNGLGRNDEFTKLQGYVYGARMDLAKLYDGVFDFVRKAAQASHTLYIVSHKTKAPLLGERYDMHESARGFLHNNNLVAADGIDAENIFFELSKEEKITRVKTLQLDAFIDDLPEILNLLGARKNLRRLLFDPDCNYQKSAFERHENWASLDSALLGKERC